MSPRYTYFYPDRRKAKRETLLGAILVFLMILVISLHDTLNTSTVFLFGVFPGILGLTLLNVAYVRTIEPVDPKVLLNLRGFPIIALAILIKRAADALEKIRRH